MASGSSQWCMHTYLHAFCVPLPVHASVEMNVNTCHASVPPHGSVGICLFVCLLCIRTYSVVTCLFMCLLCLPMLWPGHTSLHVCYVPDSPTHGVDTLVYALFVSQCWLFPCLLCFRVIKWVAWVCLFTHLPWSCSMFFGRSVHMFTMPQGCFLVAWACMFLCVPCYSATIWWPGHACSHAFPVPVLQMTELFVSVFAYSLCLSSANCWPRQANIVYIVPVLHMAVWACLLTCLPWLCASTWQTGHACLHSCCIPVLCLAELLAYLLCPCATIRWPVYNCCACPSTTTGGLCMPVSPLLCMGLSMSLSIPTGFQACKAVARA